MPKKTSLASKIHNAFQRAHSDVVKAIAADEEVTVESFVPEIYEKFSLVSFPPVAFAIVCGFCEKEGIEDPDDSKKLVEIVAFFDEYRGEEGQAYARMLEAEMRAY